MELTPEQKAAFEAAEKAKALRDAKALVAAAELQAEVDALPDQFKGAAKLDEVVAAFIKGRDEMTEQAKTFGETSQETKNLLQNLQVKMDSLSSEVKAGPNYARTDAQIRDGFKGQSPDLQLKFEAYGLFLRKGADEFYRQATPEQKKALMGESKTLLLSDDDGAGFLAPGEWDKEILKDIIELNKLRALVRVSSINSSSLNMIKRTKTMAAFWPGEAQPSPASEPNFGTFKIQPFNLTALVYASREMLQDNSFDLEGELFADAAEQFAVAEALAFLRGSGDERPTGILTDAAVQARFSKTASATVLTPEAIIAAVYALKQPYATNATILLHRQTLRMIRLMKDLEGRFLWSANLGLTTKQLPSILDLPYSEAPEMDAPDATTSLYASGNIPIIVADFRRGYRVVDRTQMDTLRDDYTLADKGIVRFVMRRRTGGRVTQPEAFQLVKTVT